MGYWEGHDSWVCLSDGGLLCPVFCLFVGLLVWTLYPFVAWFFIVRFLCCVIFVAVSIVLHRLIIHSYLIPDADTFFRGQVHALMMERNARAAGAGAGAMGFAPPPGLAVGAVTKL